MDTQRVHLLFVMTVVVVTMLKTATPQAFAENVIQITDNEVGDTAPDIFGDAVVWQNWRGIGNRIMLESDAKAVTPSETEDVATDGQREHPWPQERQHRDGIEAPRSAPPNTTTVWPAKHATDREYVL